MPDRFEDMRTFVAVVRGDGFNAAADRLGIAKSAVSRRIRELEDRLSARLINRTTRRISLTEAGQSFFERATRLLEDLAEAEDLVSTGSQEAVGRLRIAAPVSFGAHCLAPVVSEFLERHPRLSIDVAMNDRIVDIVADGFDLAVRIAALKDSTLIARRIATIRHVAVASPAYLASAGRPQRPADLAKHAGVAYANVEPRAYWMFRDGESLEPVVRLTFDNGDAVREAAIAGAGVALLPTFIAHKAIDRGDLEIILADYMRPPIAMSVVYPSTRNVPAKLRLFIDHLAARFGEEPFWDKTLFAAQAPATRASGAASV